MTNAILFILAYLFIIAALLWANYRWHNYLNQTAIPGLDYVTPITDAEYEAAQNGTI